MAGITLAFQKHSTFAVACVNFFLADRNFFEKTVWWVQEQQPEISATLTQSTKPEAKRNMKLNTSDHAMKEILHILGCFTPLAQTSTVSHVQVSTDFRPLCGGG